MGHYAGAQENSSAYRACCEKLAYSQCLAHSNWFGRLSTGWVFNKSVVSFQESDRVMVSNLLGLNPERASMRIDNMFKQQSIPRFFGGIRKEGKGRGSCEQYPYSSR